MHLLALSLVFTGLVFTIVSSFAVYWPVALWARDSITPASKAAVLALPFCIGLLLVVSPLVRSQSTGFGFYFSSLPLAAASVFAGLLSVYLFGLMVGRLTARLDRWLLVAFPAWLLLVLVMSLAWAAAFYFLAGPSDCSLAPGFPSPDTFRVTC